MQGIEWRIQCECLPSIAVLAGIEMAQLMFQLYIGDAMSVFSKVLLRKPVAGGGGRNNNCNAGPCYEGKIFHGALPATGLLLKIGMCT